MISFLWPELLWSLLLLPLLLAFYLWLLHRRRQALLQVPDLTLLRQAAGAQRLWRRHLPPALLWLALALLLIGSARPSMRLKLPSQQQTIILAMDVSGSMRATDVRPNRLSAAQDAARSFVRSLPRQVRVGVVAFAGTAALVQAPTHNRDDVMAAIDRFQLQRGTAIGSGILVSLAALLPEAGIDVGALGTPSGLLAPTTVASAASMAASAPPRAPGSYTSGAVILLTDGQRTTGPNAQEAARIAADRGVKVYTVGIGTRGGEVISFEGWSLHTRLDEEALKSIAGTTRAGYFYAGSAEDLQQVYRGLSSRLVVERRDTEVTALLALAGALLALIGGALSLWWFGRTL